MRKQRIFTVFILSAIMFFLIIDSRTAISGAQEGIALCMKSVIPALLPFMTISIVLTNEFSCFSFPVLRKIYSVPCGAEGIVLSGFLGGYPVGAQCIAHGYSAKQLSYEDTLYMLSFCNQAGPSFIFGILAQQFPTISFAWTLWIIQIISTVFVANSQFHNSQSLHYESHASHITISEALKKSVSSLGYICGWIILFRILISIAENHILWVLPGVIKPMVYGLLELTNGLLMLSNINDTALRFIVASILLSCGGLCVAMQTSSVTHGLPLRTYVHGKMLQTAYSFLLSFTAIHSLPQFGRRNWKLAALPFCVCIILSYIMRKTQKTVAYKKGMVYNESNIRKKDTVCCLERKSNAPAPTVSTV